MVVSLGVAVVAFGFQQTGVIPAIPAIRRSFDASQTWSAWLTTGYLVASVIFTPLAGKLADRYGKRRLLLGSLAMFLLGSAGAASAPSLGWLLGARALQGGGGAVFPLTLAIARDEMPEGRTGTAIGVLTGGFGLGTLLGFGGGGAIVQALDWRWVFIAGGVAVAGAIALAWYGVPHSTVRTKAGLDLAGGALLTGGLAVLLVALTEAPSAGWGSPWIVAGFVVSPLLLVSWALYDLRVEEPLLDLHVLGERTVLLANLGAIGMGFALFETYFLVPFLVQGSGHGYGFGADTLQSGLFLLPAAVGQLLAGPLGPRLADRISAAWTYTLGLGLLAVALAGLAFLHGHEVLVAVWTLLVGAGVGLAIDVGSDVVAEGVAEEETGIATSLNSVLRRLGGGIGGQVAAALLAGLTVAGQPTNGAFVAAFVTGAIVAAVGGALTLGIPRGG